MGMSIPYEATGRTAQKQRTRNALVDAARSLISRGQTPTVEDAAAEASISRTTAYRYFPNQRQLLEAVYPQLESGSLLGDDPPEDVAVRLDLVVDRLLRMTVDNEPAMRAMLRLSLDTDTTDRESLLLRRGRAIAWLHDALEPLRGCLAPRELDRLVHAIRSCAGIEALVWLCDIAGLSREDAIATMKWSARALLRSALDT